MRRRIAVTGIGWVTPLGHAVQEVWKSLLAGTSGIGPIAQFDASRHATRIAAEVRNFNPDELVDKREARRLDRFAQFAVVAGLKAVQDAALDVSACDPYRIGVIVGSGAGGIASIERGERRLEEFGPGKVPPLSIPMMMSNAAASVISRIMGLHGPSFGPVAACATGAVSVAQAANMILMDQADIMLAGGSEASITPLSLAAFSTCGALSNGWNDEPKRASRPFDVRRDGFVMGEGSGVLVLEDMDRAQARGARIYAELAGFGLTSDAHHITAPDPTSEPAARAMTTAVKSAGATPADVKYINAHGTSTQMNDAGESRAIRLAFGQAADGIAVSSSKSMLGHLLGAAGAVEAAITALSVFHGEIHPTINVDEQDPACDIDVVPAASRKMPDLRLALSNSFAFGGHNVSLAFRRIESKQ